MPKYFFCLTDVKLLKCHSMLWPTLHYKLCRIIYWLWSHETRSKSGAINPAFQSPTSLSNVSLCQSEILHLKIFGHQCWKLVMLFHNVCCLFVTFTIRFHLSYLFQKLLAICIVNFFQKNLKLASISFFESVF